MKGVPGSGDGEGKGLGDGTPGIGDGLGDIEGEGEGTNLGDGIPGLGVGDGVGLGIGLGDGLILGLTESIGEGDGKGLGEIEGLGDNLGDGDILGEGDITIGIGDGKGLGDIKGDGLEIGLTEILGLILGVVINEGEKETVEGSFNNFEILISETSCFLKNSFISNSRKPNNLPNSISPFGNGLNSPFSNISFNLNAFTFPSGVLKKTLDLTSLPPTSIVFSIKGNPVVVFNSAGSSKIGFIPNSTALIPFSGVNPANLVKSSEGIELIDGCPGIDGAGGILKSLMFIPVTPSPLGISKGTLKSSINISCIFNSIAACCSSGKDFKKSSTALAPFSVLNVFIGLNPAKGSALLLAAIPLPVKTNPAGSFTPLLVFGPIPSLVKKAEATPFLANCSPGLIDKASPNETDFPTCPALISGNSIPKPPAGAGDSPGANTGSLPALISIILAP